MFQLVCVQNGHVGVADIKNEREVLGEFKTYEGALAEAEGKFNMLKRMRRATDRLKGTPEDFTNTVTEGPHATYTDHYFIEEA